MIDEKILFTLLLAAFALLGNIFRKGGLWERLRNRPPPPSPGGPRQNPGGGAASPDAQMRRLLEALGRPVTDSAPPPLPLPTKSRPPVLTARPPERTGDFFPLPSQPGAGSKKRKRERERSRRHVPLPPVTISSPPPPPLPKPGLVVSERSSRETAVPGGGALKVMLRPGKPAANSTALRERLIRRGSAREAVLLAEILGPPLALRLPAAEAQFT